MVGIKSSYAPYDDTLPDYDFPLREEKDAEENLLWPCALYVASWVEVDSALTDQEIVGVASKSLSERDTDVLLRVMWLRPSPAY